MSRVWMVLVGLLFGNGMRADKKEWTWTFNKQFSSVERMHNKQQAHVFFSKENTPLFTQLLFSWNAYRPEQGSFSFFVQVRDAQTHAWGAWHKMMDWGKTVQRSYSSKSDGKAQYFHVRLETGHHKADAFRVKIQANDQADLSLVYRLTVCVSDFSLFRNETDLEYVKKLKSVHVGNVPKKSQMTLAHPRAHEMCSPTSSSILTSYVCDCHVDPLEFARHVFDDGLNAYGSWAFNTAHAFEQCKGSIYFSIQRCSSFKQLHHYLKKNIPVVVSVRGALQGAPKIYPRGHLLVVVGWDAAKQEIICHDPAFGADDATVVRYSLQTFLPAWERSHRLAYVADEIKIS